MADIKIDNVTVLGAGVLGGQIAWHSAFMGKNVTIFDPFEEALEKARASHQTYAGIYANDLNASDNDLHGAHKRVQYLSEMAPSVAEADLIIEAVPEAPEIKADVYQEMAGLLREHTLIATNSSTLLPRDFAQATGRPEKYCALHFANLIWELNLVEIMAHPGTSEDTLSSVTKFAIDIGMVPIPVQKEKNGYVLNSWLVPLVTHSLALVVNGVSTPEDVDRTYMIANRGCARGPLGTVDIIGMKTAYDISKYWGEVNNDEQMLKNAEYLEQNFLAKGRLGLMSGEGFYKYPNPAYEASDFLDIPSYAAIPTLVKRSTL